MFYPRVSFRSWRSWAYIHPDGVSQPPLRSSVMPPLAKYSLYEVIR